MRYAVISDIHGNIHALRAVLNDAHTQDIDRYIFLGDYYADFPYPNEVAQCILGMENSVVLRGNKEDYLIDLSRQNPSTWQFSQFAALYWNYRTLKPDYLQRYMQLPQYVEETMGAKRLRMAHSSGSFFHGEASLKLSSHRYMEKMRKEPFTHAEYLDFVHQQLSSNHALQGALAGCESDVYLFGHTHVQWHACISGVYLVNSGSCGLPLDFDVRAAYTVIDDAQHSVCIDERRAAYDVGQMVDDIRKSEAYPVAKLWYDVIILQLSTGEDYINRFLNFVKDAGARHGEVQAPYSNTVWQTAGEAWFDALTDVRILL